MQTFLLDPMQEFLLILTSTVIIDLLVIYYIYKKSGNGIALRIMLIFLLSTDIITLTNTSQRFVENDVFLQSVFSILVMGVINLFLVFFSIYYIITYISNPINEIISINEEIAEGRLNLNSGKIKASGEVFRLKNANVKLMNSLISTFTAISALRDQYVQSSSELASASEEVNAF